MLLPRRQIYGADEVWHQRVPRKELCACSHEVDCDRLAKGTARRQGEFMGSQRLDSPAQDSGREVGQLNSLAVEFAACVVGAAEPRGLPLCHAFPRGCCICAARAGKGSIEVGCGGTILLGMKAANRESILMSVSDPGNDQSFPGLPSRMAGAEKCRVQGNRVTATPTPFHGRRIVCRASNGAQDRCRHVC